MEKKIEHFDKVLAIAIRHTLDAHRFISPEPCMCQDCAALRTMGYDRITQEDAIKKQRR